MQILTFFTVEIFNNFLLTELVPVGTAWTLSVYGWDAAAEGDAQDLIPPSRRAAEEQGQEDWVLHSRTRHGDASGHAKQGALGQWSLLCPIFGLNQLNVAGKGQKMGKEHECRLV